MKQPISFNLNGQSVTVNVVGEESLLTVIRSYLNKTGTKYGCGIGECGACTVLVDKEPVRSCMLLVEDVADKEVITIEGMEQDGRLHPLQQAFVDHDALQCGYCTPGMIMNAYGTLLKDVNATKETILNSMESNLCRCGSYNRIIEAIESAAKELKD